MWTVGTWLGIDYKTGQYVFWADNDIRYCRTMLRMPDAQKWSAESLATITGTPWDVHAREAAAPEVVFKPRDEVAETAARAEEPLQRRRVYIKQSDIEAFGYTEGCPRCEHGLRYGPNKTQKGHNDACRARIMGELSKTPEGQSRIAKINARIDESATEHIEQAERRKEPDAQGEMTGMDARSEAAVAESLKFIPFPETTTGNAEAAPERERERVRPAERHAEVSDDAPVRHESEPVPTPLSTHEHEPAMAETAIEGDMDIGYVRNIGKPIQDDMDSLNFLKTFDLADRDEMRQVHTDIMDTILLMGGSGPSYRRERRKQSQAIVS